jgi:hypothetical protein
MPDRRVWDALAKFGIPKTFNEDITQAHRQLLKLRRLYGPLLGAGHWGPTYGDGLDTAVKRLESLMGVRRPNPNLQPINRPVVDMAWHLAPPHKRRGRNFAHAVSLVYEAATGIPGFVYDVTTGTANKRLDRERRAVRQKMRTARNKK